MTIIAEFFIPLQGKTNRLNLKNTVIVHIAIAGNIGSGKTTLTTMLAKYYHWTPKFEAVDYNPYLEDYYKDIPRWSFNLEIYFLKQRFKDLLEIAKSQQTIIQDRSIFEGVYVFTATNKAMGNLSDRDFDTYMGLFESMMMIVEYPDLMIYLRASVPHLVENIQKRGRDYEQTMQLEYLKNLNERYEDFIFNKYKGKVLAVDVDDIDFQHNQKDFAQIVDKIDAQLFGFFPNE
jgi:deoxyadenosine/deoxycytidine kinase